MMRPVRLTLGVLTALALAGGSAALSRVPYTVDRPGRAELRVAWRARAERIQSCRKLSASELQALPAHMRQEEICEGTTARYRLRITVDDSVRVDAVVRAAGARHDRLLYVFQEIPVAAGGHRVRVAFAALDAPAAKREEQEDTSDSAGAKRDAHDTDEERTLGAARRIERSGEEEIVPRMLSLDETIVLAPETRVLVTYASERRKLVLLTGRQTPEKQ